MNKDKIVSSYEKYFSEQKKIEDTNKKIFEELKPVANRLFSTEDGRVYARQMIRAARILDVEAKALTSDDLQRLQAIKDFVNLFLTKLVDRKVFISILEEI